MRYQPRCSTLPEVGEPGLAVGAALAILVVGFICLMSALVGDWLPQYIAAVCACRN